MKTTNKQIKKIKQENNWQEGRNERKKKNKRQYDNKERKNKDECEK